MRREPHPYLHGELVVVIDCAQLDRSAGFWAGALGYVRDGTATARYQSLWPPDGRGLEVLLQQVPGASRARTGSTSTCALATLSPRHNGWWARAPGY